MVLVKSWASSPGDLGVSHTRKTAHRRTFANFTERPTPVLQTSRRKLTSKRCIENTQTAQMKIAQRRRRGAPARRQQTATQGGADRRVGCTPRLGGFVWRSAGRTVRDRHPGLTRSLGELVDHRLGYVPDTPILAHLFRVIRRFQLKHGAKLLGSLFLST